MLLTLLMNLKMFGGDIPPEPDTHGGGTGKAEEHVKDQFQLIKKDDEDFLIIMSKWVSEQN